MKEENESDTDGRHETEDTIVVGVFQAPSGFFVVIRSIKDGKEAVLTWEGSDAIPVSQEEYGGYIETQYLLSDPDMATDLDRTRRTPVSEMEVWKCPTPQ